MIVSCGGSDDAIFIKPNPSDGISNNQGGNNVDNSNDTTNDSNNTTYSSASLEDITSDFNAFMGVYGFHGAQIAITHHNRLVYLESFGKSDVEQDINMSNTSRFRIASISKPLTLTAISKLVAQNKVKLNDLVFGQGALLGTEYGNLPYETGEMAITVEHLLAHKAGFKNFPDVMYEDVAMTQTQLIGKMLDERSLVTTPGKIETYSNFGYLVLGRIIEKVTGGSYEDFMINEVYEKMGLSDIQLGGNSMEDALENEVTYYGEHASPYEMNITRMDAAAGWVANAKDLATFAMKSDLEESVPDFLPIQNRLSYLQKNDWYHNGALAGSLSVLQVSYPTSYVVLVNTSGANAGEILQAIRNFMRGKLKNRTDWPTAEVTDNE